MSWYGDENEEVAYHEAQERRMEEERQAEEYYSQAEAEHWIEVCAREGHEIYATSTGISERCHCGIVSMYDVMARPDLYGSCSRCDRVVDNRDPNHRVTAIVEGGRGVECKLRGDYR